MLGRGLSLHLDLLRVLAAMGAVLCHLGQVPVEGLSVFSMVSPWGHQAVMVFFVLSGFVIHHAAQTGERSLESFATSRITRIYSVVVPCILLTILCDQIGMRLAPDLYSYLEVDRAQGSPAARALWSLFMLNESWLRLRMFSNLPYWSLCFEVWYYALFAAWFYCTGRTRLLLTGGLALVAGPRILLLFPVWIMGALAYRETASTNWRAGTVWLAFLQPLAIAAIWLAAGVEPPAFVGDYVLGLSVALHLMAAKRLDAPLVATQQCLEPVVRWIAARSFTLYLLHMPLMYLTMALVEPLAGRSLLGVPLCAVLVTFGTIGLPLLVASPIENQRYRLRPLVRRAITYLRPDNRGDRHGQQLTA
jgi:peptidoglycan/LPS O-acetylase OafA/YrhL